MTDFTLGRAVDGAFSLLGEPSKNALLYQLKRGYNLDIYRDNVNIGKLESALQDMLGEGADVLMSLVKKQLGKDSLANQGE
jgi:hypothetical protein